MQNLQARGMGGAGIEAVLRAQAAQEGATDFETMRRHCRTALKRFIVDRTKRYPIIVPVVMEA